MFGLPDNLSEYPLAITLLLIFIAVVGYMLKREDKKDSSQSNLNQEYLKTLYAIQNDLKNNWEHTQQIGKVTQEMSSTVRDTAKVLANIKCLK